MDNPFSIAAASSADLIHVTAPGLWTPTQVMFHFRDLQSHLRKMRNEKGFARVLIDMRDALVQPADTARTLHDETKRAYREQDRVAVVCSKALVAIQMKHGTAHYNRATFTNVEEATAWLFADAATASTASGIANKVAAGR